MGPDSHSKDPPQAGSLERATLVVNMRILSLGREESGLAKRKDCCGVLFIERAKIRGYRKRMLSLLLQKGIFWVSEQRLVDQANTIRRNSWMTGLNIEELERKLTGSDSVIVEQARSVEALPDYVKDMRNVLPEMEAEKQADSLDEEELAIVMEIAEVIERGRKYKLPALRIVPKKKFEETAKVDKVLSKFKTHSITKTNGLFCAGAVFVTDRLGLKIEKLKKDLSQLEASIDKDISNFRQCERLKRK